MDAITGLDEEGFRARSTPGEWTAAEVLAHLLDDEPKLLGYASAALDADSVAVAATADEERGTRAKEAAQSAAGGPVPQIIHGLLAQRRDTLSRLEALSPEQLARPVRHPSYDEATVASLFERIAEHEEGHATQIRTIRAQIDRNRQDASAL